MKILSLILIFVGVSLAQDPLQQTPYQVIDARTGVALPCVGCQIYTYVAGTTTPSPTYTDHTIGTPNTNPVLTNAAGYAVNGSAITGIWVGGVCLKIVLEDASNVTIWTQDYVCDFAASLALVLANAANTYPYVLSTGYATFALACTGAVAVNKPLLIISALTAIPTQTCAANLMMTSPGSLQPASGALVNLTGPFTPCTYRCLDISAGGNFDFSQNIYVGEVSSGWFNNSTNGINAAAYSLYVNQQVLGMPIAGLHITNVPATVTNVNITSNAHPSGCFTSGNCYSPAYIRGDGQTATTLIAASGSSGYVLSAIGLVNTEIKDIGINGGTALQNCLDIHYPVTGPSLTNVFRNIRCTNYLALGIRADNQNDSIFDNIVVDGSNSGSTAYAMKVPADAGACGFRQLNIDTGKLFIDCQSYAIGGGDKSYINQGLEIGYDSADTGTITNAQIDFAPDTNKVINCTQSTACENLTLNGVYLSPSGLTSGGDIFAGPWYTGIVMNGGWVNLGTNSGTLCGVLADGCNAITTPASGYFPKLVFNGTWFVVYPGIPAQPVTTTGTFVAYHTVNDARTGIIITPDIDTQDLANGYVQHQYGGGLYGTLNSSNNTCAITSISFATDYFFSCASDGSTYIKAQTGKGINFVIAAGTVGVANANGMNISSGEVYSVAATPGVSCTGSPTTSFASVGGIVTHC